MLSSTGAVIVGTKAEQTAEKGQVVLDRLGGLLSGFLVSEPPT
jgi:hypothetical protein